MTQQSHKLIQDPLDSSQTLQVNEAKAPEGDANGAELVNTDGLSMEKEYVPPKAASDEVLQVAGNKPMIGSNIKIDTPDQGLEAFSGQDLVTPYPLGQLQGDLLLSLKSETGAFSVIRSSHATEQAHGENHPHFVYQFEIKSDTTIFICRHRFNDFKQLQKQLDFKPLPKPTKWWYFGGNSEEFAQERENVLKEWLTELLNDFIFRKRTAVLDFLQNWK